MTTRICSLWGFSALAIVAFIFGVLASYILGIGRVMPDEDDIKSKLAAEYFRRASLLGLTGGVRFNDCKITPATGSVLTSGTARYYGNCFSAVNGRTIALSLGLSESGYIVFIDEGSI